MVVFGWWLDLMILEVFSNLQFSDSLTPSLWPFLQPSSAPTPTGPCLSSIADAQTWMHKQQTENKDDKSTEIGDTVQKSQNFDGKKRGSKMN